MSTGALFNKRTLGKAVDAAPHPSDLQREVATRWARLVRTPFFSLENEKPHQGQFLSEIFGTVLGFRQMANADSNGEFHLRAESASMETAGGKTPDAQLGFFGTGSDQVRAVVELKSPGADLDARQHREGRLTAIEQGFGYVPKFDGCRWVLVSNFLTVRLYWTVRGEGYVWSTDVGKFDDDLSLREALAVLHRSQLLGSHAAGTPPTAEFAELARRDEKAITHGFYAFYKSTRSSLFDVMAAFPHPSIVTQQEHERRMLRNAQTILDRLLFVCFAEDTDLLPSRVLNGALNQASAGFVDTTRWQQLKGLFAAIDKGRIPVGITAYNGGLFAHDSELDELEIPDDALEFIYEMSRYDFSEELGVDVLGRVFEQSITDIEALHAEIDGADAVGRGETSKRKKDGVFYTPDWVTRYVAEQALGRWLRHRFDERRAEFGADEIPATHHRRRHTAELEFWEAYQTDLRTVKVLDPACGSGAFLAAAYETLLTEYNRTNRALAELRGGQAGLFDPDREILEGNLYGVDINSESVEITRLSLWLKTARRGRPLTALDATIRCGNSLISPPNLSDSDRYRRAFGELDPSSQALSFDWYAAFPEVFDCGTRPDGRTGFDVVIGNPPYVRGEWLPAKIKAVLERFDVFSKKADLLVYFYERSIDLLAPGGVHGFIVSNKWLKASYGGPLRSWLSDNARLNILVDFGHAPIFEDADTFPIITIMSTPAAQDEEGDTVQLATVPRADLGAAGLAQLVNDRAFVVNRSRFGGGPWSLEPPDVDLLMDRLRRSNPSLADATGRHCRYGVKTGYNEAFVADLRTRDGLVQKDPRSAEVIRPIIGGRDLGRWITYPHEEYLIALVSSGDRTWPWSTAVDPTETFARTYPAIFEHLTTDQSPEEHRLDKLKQRSDQGEHWWELRSCSYYQEFESPKIVFTDIAWQPEVALDDSGTYVKNTAFFIPTADRWALAVLNSPVVWWYAWRAFQHGKDEALRWLRTDVEALPFPVANNDQAEEATQLVDRLIKLSRARQSATRELLAWLSHEYGVVEPSASLRRPETLTTEDFIRHVKPNLQDKSLSLASTVALTRAHSALATAAEEQQATARRHEQRLAELVELAYGLDAEQRALLRATAPPRTPLYSSR